MVYIEPVKQDETIKIAERLAIGDTFRNIARDTGTSPATVCRRANDPEIKKLVDEIRESHYKDNLQRAKDNFTHFINECTKTDNNSIRFLGFKASERTLESAGVLSGPNQAIYIQNVYNDHSQTLISPVIMQLLEEQRRAMDNLIDCKVVTEDSDSSVESCNAVYASVTHTNQDADG